MKPRTQLPRRVLGLLLAVFSLTPIYRLLLGREAGPAGAASIRAAEGNLELVLSGAGVALLVGLVIAVLGRPRTEAGAGADERIASAMGYVVSLLTRPSTLAWVLGVGVLTTGLSLAVGTLLYHGLLTSVDEMVSVIHARFLAYGLLAGPVGEEAAAWMLPNALIVEDGWVSQYPPGHLLLLGLGARWGLLTLVGPLLAGAMVTLVAASAERLFEPVIARPATLLLAVSPFVFLMGGGALSHLSAGAGAALTLYAVVRATEGKAAWAVLAGVAIGVMVTSRPWVGLVLGGFIPLALWIPERGRGSRWWGSRVGLLAAGGGPFAAGLLAFNLRLFGHPLRLGYEAAYGPAHGLGFHRDPWGYPYGPIEALAYTSADVLSFGVQALETAIPVTLVVAVALTLAARLPRYSGVLVGWALLPVAANALYWFHQPRMLYESAPAWILLAVVGVVALYRSTPPGFIRRWWVGSIAAAALVSLVAFTPQRILSYAWGASTLDRIVDPVPDGETPLVFVHASWNERLAADLQGLGMRSDSINPLVRRNDACDLQAYVAWRRAGADPQMENAAVGSAVVGRLDFGATPGSPPGLRLIDLGPGASVRLRPTDALASECLRQARADRLGAVALAPLVWQGDLPGLPKRGPMFVRDFGPERNAALRERFSDREALVFTRMEVEGRPRLVPFEEAMAALWSGPESVPDTVTRSETPFDPSR